METPPLTQEEAKPKERRWWFWFRVLFSGGLLWVLMSRLDWQQLVVLVSRSQWPLLGVAIGGTALSLTFSVLRWALILDDLGLHVAHHQVWRLVLSGFFFNQFLPSTVGGDGYRFLWLARRFPNRQGDILSSLLLDRGYGFIALLGVHGTLLPFLWPFIWRQPMLSLLEGSIVVGALLLSGLLLIARKRPWQQWLRASAKMPKRLKPWISALGHLMEALLGRNRRTVWLSLGYSAAFVVCNGLTLGIYLRLVGLAPSWMMGLYASSLAAIVGMVPLSLNGLGLMEGAMILALEPLGWPREAILLAAFWLRAINLLEAALGGVLYLLEGWKYP